MHTGYLQILVPIIAILLNSFIQISFYKLLPEFGLLKSEYAGFIAGFFTVLITGALVFFSGGSTLNNIIGVLIANLIIYFCLGFLYFTFINLGETARRIRLLRELLNAKEGLSLKEILNLYNAKEIIEKRISRLEGNRQIIRRSDGNYNIGSNFLLLIAKTIVLLKLIVLGKKSEFD